MRKPDPTYWIAADVDDIHLLDRYKTEAARSATRSLKNLQTIQKMERDEQRWQLQLEIAEEKTRHPSRTMGTPKKQKESTPQISRGRSRRNRQCPSCKIKV